MNSTKGQALDQSTLSFMARVLPKSTLLISIPIVANSPVAPMTISALIGVFILSNVAISRLIGQLPAHRQCCAEILKTAYNGIFVCLPPLFIDPSSPFWLLSVVAIIRIPFVFENSRTAYLAIIAVAGISTVPFVDLTDFQMAQLTPFFVLLAIALPFKSTLNLFWGSLHKLQDSEKKFRDLYNHSPDMYASIDPETGTFVDCNQTLQLKLGYKKEELIGQSVFFVYHPDCHEEVKEAFSEFVETGAVNSKRLFLRTKSNIRRPVLLDVSSARDKNGKVLWSRSTWKDISHLVEIENEREKSQLKSEFLAKMSHELRTPMNAVLGYTQLLEKIASKANHTQYLQDLSKIKASGYHLLNLINDVLDLSKIESGNFELNYETFDLRKAVNLVEEVAGSLALRNENTFNLECPKDIGDMRSDSTKLHQILLNLIGNAFKFTENGSVKLIIAEESQNEREGIRIEIEDTGIGLSEEQLKKIFAPFIQADSSTTRKFGGTGLGLAITKQYVDLMEGEIQVISQLGKGSKFIVWLPRTQKSRQAKVA